MPITAIEFVSRNKDNKQLPGFKPRVEGYLISHEIDEKIIQKFYDFVDYGVTGELCRFYVSVNERNPIEINKSLAIYLINNPDYDSARIPKKLQSIAMFPKNALTKKWLFDFDSDDSEALKAFTDDIKTHGLSDEEITIRKSISGYHVIVDHGFDTRKLLEKYPDVDLKRDDAYIYSYAITDVSLDIKLKKDIL